MTAIMGPSGSGKSTFMNALIGRVVEGGGKRKVTVKGRRWEGGVELGGGDKVRAAYVQQTDNLFSQMTVEETLTMRAMFKFPQLGRRGIGGVVDEVIERMDLGGCREVKVGGGKVRGVSGGERKRVSIGMMIMDGPAIVVLDEPTSGLDSFQANKVVARLRKMREGGTTVACVIHQPSAKVLNMFDNLILMSGGR